MKYKAKISTYEKDLERFYLKKFEKESQKLKKNYEFQIKVKIEEKDKMLNLLLSDIAKYKELDKQYQISYISLNDHELILNKIRNDMEKEISMLKAKLNLTKFKLEQSQFTSIHTNGYNNSKQRKASVITSLIKNFINVDTYNSAIESTAKFSYTNTEYKECLTSTRNRDHKNMFILHRSTDANYLNTSNLNEKNYYDVMTYKFRIIFNKKIQLIRLKLFTLI